MTDNGQSEMVFAITFRFHFKLEKTDRFYYFLKTFYILPDCEKVTRFSIFLPRCFQKITPFSKVCLFFKFYKLFLFTISKISQHLFCLPSWGLFTAASLLINLFTFNDNLSLLFPDIQFSLS